MASGSYGSGAISRKRKHDMFLSLASGSYGSDVISREPWKHDVFLSFRGEDTRRTFTSHLFHCLKEKGINAFMDDSLPRGEDIGSQLIDTIRSSRISVIVFSRNYANSRWCLQELDEIMECRKKSPGQMVLPVFYDVDPSDVRKQTGPFEEAFAKHEEDKKKEIVARWKAALAEAGSLSGWDITDTANGTEAEIVREIAKRICDKLSRTYLDVAKYPVGLENRMVPVNRLLNDSSNDVRFIVIYGIGGIGKTTLATAVYNKFFHTFEAKSFLAKVGENSKHPNGLVHLQEQLLYDILNFQEIKVENTHQGSNVIKERLSNRRVLIILDDITHRDQLKVLAREREWFGSGSRIIITTRDADTVKEIKADYIHRPETLDYHESRCLFSMHAFERNHPKEEFKELSEAVVGYCKGLPLALEVLGGALLNESVEEWKKMLQRLRRIPHSGIQEKLEISYHALGRSERELFLDIACFFVGWDKDYVFKILNGCKANAEAGLSVLIRRNLVRITRRNELEMHDLIRDMGKEIVCRESRNTGERSRLFFHEDVLTTLRNHLGTENVEGLALCSPELGEELSVKMVDAKAFAGMRRLRLLQLNSLQVHGDYGLISKELRWLSWHGFSSNFLPDELYVGNLVVIDMQYSKLRETWRTPKFLGKLKVLNLSHSHFLTKTPDFSKLPNLEELIMEDCKELKEVDGSIGLLKRLVLLNLRDCKKLGSIPDDICGVTSLQILHISGCSKIQRLPDDLGKLESLTELLANGAPITHLPLSFKNLKKLEKLHLFGYKKLQPSSISNLIWSWISKGKAPKVENNQLTTPFSGFRFLTELCLKECNLSDDGILEGIGSLQSLVIMDLRRSHFRHLTSSITRLFNLKKLIVWDCPEVESISDLPPNVRWAIFSNCPSLAEISYSNKWNPDLSVMLYDCHNISANFRDSILKDLSWGNIYIQGSNVPEWFEYQSGRPSLSFQLPSCHELDKITILWVMQRISYSSFRVGLTNKITGRGLWTWHFAQLYPPSEDHIYAISIAPSRVMGNRKYKSTKVGLELKIESASCIVKRVGVHLGERCQSCGPINVDDVEAGPSHGGSSKEYPSEDQPTTGIAVDEQLVMSIKDFDSSTTRISLPITPPRSGGTS